MEFGAIPPGWSFDYENVEFGLDYAKIIFFCTNCSAIKDIIE
jgi:hypothetical protein